MHVSNLQYVMHKKVKSQGAKSKKHQTVVAIAKD